MIRKEECFAALPHLSSRQLPVFNPVWLIGCGAQARFAIGFIVRIIPFEPGDLAVAFEREDVRRNTIEEPAVV